MQQKQILDPYKTLGLFVSGPASTSSTAPFTIATVCENSFKLYSDQLLIKMVSPNFEHKIKAIHVHNQCTYVLVGNKVIKLKYHHVVQEWTLPIPPNNTGKTSTNGNLKIDDQDYGVQLFGSFCVFQGVVIVGLGQFVYVIVEGKSTDDAQIETINIGMNISELVHPVTYINKVLAYSFNRILLVNPISNKILFDYKELIADHCEDKKSITKVCPSPLIDIVAICFDSGDILISNIRHSKLVFTIKQKKSVSAIAFSQSQSYMVTGDVVGNIILWDLQNKRIIYRLQSAFPSAVTNIFFTPGYPLITCTSSPSNSIRQFHINLQNSQTLLLHRERTGTASNIQSFKIQNNKEITFCTKNETIFSSIYSHGNMYTLGYCLDSLLPYHLRAQHFNVQVYRERTRVGKIGVGEVVGLGRISKTGKFVIVATNTRVIKLAIPSGSNPTTTLQQTCTWPIASSLQIALHNEHSIYILCTDWIHVLQFSSPNITATINSNTISRNLTQNLNQGMLALQNCTLGRVQIWDMRSIKLCRMFSMASFKGGKNQENQQICAKLCFSADNRYLLAALNDCRVLVWSIVDNDLYRVVNLESRIKDMSFTPDGGYFMCLLQNKKQINIWHNYIGKISTTESSEKVLKFKTSLNYLTQDFRQELNRKQIKQNLEKGNKSSSNDFDSLLNEIPDCPDVQIYDFGQASKWMPLLYYDEIKSRNSIAQGQNQQDVALPFFLDFKNLSEQQSKIATQMKKEEKEKKSKHQQKIDSQLSNQTHQIKLSQKSTPKHYIQTWNTLQSLSIAQLDYQLRKYLLLPNNLPYILKMFSYLLSQKQQQKNKFAYNQMIINIVLMRVCTIVGSQLCRQQSKAEVKKLLQVVREKMGCEDIVQRCLAVVGNSH